LILEFYFVCHLFFSYVNSFLFAAPASGDV